MKPDLGAECGHYDSTWRKKLLQLNGTHDLGTSLHYGVAIV